MAAQPESKADAFAQFANSLGWTARAQNITHRDYRDKTHRQAGWTAIARRGQDVVTVTWIDEVAVGPIGWHSNPDAQRVIPTLAAAQRIIETLGEPAL